MTRPDYVTCVADTYGCLDEDKPVKAWCGRRLDGFHFQSVDHAVMNGRKEARLTVCPQCRAAINKGLRNKASGAFVADDPDVRWEQIQEHYPYMKGRTR